MHKRAAELKNDRRTRRVRFLQTFGAAASFAAVVIMALFIPKIDPYYTNSQADIDGMQASLFNGTGALGYIVIAVIAFILGAAVTVFCIRLNKWNREKSSEDN